MYFTKKFALGGKNFLTVTLTGIHPEVYISCSGKTSLQLSASELDILHKSTSSLLSEPVILSSSLSLFGCNTHRKCAPYSEGLRFTTESSPDSQPLDLFDLTREEYVLGKDSTTVLIRLLPQIKACSDFISDNETSVLLAYKIVHEQLKRLSDACDISMSSMLNFLSVLKVLHQHIPMSFFVNEFKRRSPGVILSIPDLFKNVCCQFPSLYHDLGIPQ